MSRPGPRMFPKRSCGPTRWPCSPRPDRSSCRSRWTTGSNNEYSILKSFAVLEDTPGVPGLDLPDLGIASVARGFACRAAHVTTAAELAHEFKAALAAGTTAVIVVRTQPQQAML